MEAWAYLLLFFPYLANCLYDPLTILLMHPPGMRLSQKIQTGLFQAVEDLRPKIAVLKEVIVFLDQDSLQKCVQNGEKRLRILDSKTGLSDEINISEGVPLHGYNFVLILEVNSKFCQEQKVLATARPCEPLPGHRPLIGLLNICDGPRWSNFLAAKDLFRHEILHSLGFGTIEPEENLRQKSPISEGFSWFDGYRSQKAIRHFLDFSLEATKEAKRHFGCPEMRGVEADSEDKIHLNEYIYGNELMTPRLTNGKNLFSSISAAILEQTYTGKSRWYSINQTALAEENSLYWYGRGWGCQFLQNSCHQLQRWPFCSKNDLQLGFTSYCIKDRLGKMIKFNSKCAVYPFSNRKSEDSGIQATSLIYSPMKGTMGEALFRFCPVAKDVFDDKIAITSGATVIQC